MLLTRKLLNQGFLLVKLKSSLRKFYGRHLDLVDRYGISVTNDHGYVPLVVNTSRSFPHSWLIIWFVTRLTRRVPLVEQELFTLPVHPSLPPVFSGVRVTRSLVLQCICIFCRSLFVLLSFFFWPLCCLFFDIRILITPLVSSNSSWLTHINWQWRLGKNETLRQKRWFQSTFHLYVATFQQYLHMEYISLRWSDIPELVVSIRNSSIEDCC